MPKMMSPKARRTAEPDPPLLFDEGDALMSKRTDVKDSSDRYANIGLPNDDPPPGPKPVIKRR